MMADTHEEPLLTRRESLPDQTQGGPEKGPWAKWHVLAFADKVAALHASAAILLASTSLFFGPGTNAAGNRGFALFAPFAAAIFLIALIAMFLERERHGLARGLLALGSAFLAVVAAWFTGQIAPEKLFLAYYVPALLGITATLILTWGKRTAREVDEDVRIYAQQHR
jgi:hypothetical protein